VPLPGESVQVNCPGFLFDNLKITPHHVLLIAFERPLLNTDQPLGILCFQAHCLKKSHLQNPDELIAGDGSVHVVW